ncbi:MAG: S-layer homology domain-containing protein, partial [Patescibacteria group bacterium]
ASNITLSGSFTVNDAATISMSTGGTLTLDGGSADQTIDLDGQSIFNLTISNIQGGTADDIIIANNGQLNVMGALSITQGNLDLDTYNEPLTVSGGVTVTSHAQAAITTDANMTLSGAIAIGDDAVITVSGGTLTLQDDGDQAFDIDGQTLWNLTLNNRGAAADREVVLAGANLSVSGALTITRGNLDLTTNSLALDVDDGVTLADDAAAQLTSNSNITTSGSVSVGASALLALTGGTWTLNGDADQTVDFDDQPLFNLTINNSGGGSNDDITFSDGSLTMTGLLTVTAGHLDLATNSIAATISGGLTIANAAEATMITNGSVTLSGSITKGAAGTLTMSGSSNTWTIETVDATINVAAHPFYNLTITSRSGATLGAQTTVWSTLTVASGSTLSLDAYDLLLTGATIAINGKLDILSTGVPRHPGSTQFSDASYGVGGSVFVTVNAGDRNIDGLIAQTITGALTVGDDTEVITLTENGLATGVFRGSIAFANATTATVGNSSIETTTTATSTFTFTDYVDGLVVTDTAILVVGGGVGSQNNRAQRAADLLAASQAQQQEDSGGGGGGGGGGGPTGSTTPSTTTASATPTTTGTTGVTGTTGTSEAGGGTVTVSAPALAQDDGRALRVMIDGKETTLRDVPTSTWFAPYVNVLVESGIVSGYRDARGNPTGEFGPANSVTYGEVAKMALKAAGMEPGGSPALRSAKGQWSAGYVAKLESLGVSVFKDDARLNVNSPAPRGAVIQTILEVFGQDIGSATGSAYSDVSARTEHAAAIEAATADGLVSGDDGKNTFRPASAINRAETAKVIQNAMSLYGN